MSRGTDAGVRASFRDPDGVLFQTEDRILRFVRPGAVASVNAFLDSTFAAKAVDRGRLVATRRIDGASVDVVVPALPDDTGTGAWLEHDRIDLPTYAYEWSPRMLHAAAALTLSLATESLDHGFGLKDATPDNVLFRGPTPVFVDVLSFELRDPLDPTWLPYAQFVRTFLLPLLVSRELGLPIGHLLLGRRDGLDPGEVYRWCSWAQRLRSPFRSLVTVPTWLARPAERMSDLYRPRRETRPDKARYVLQSVLRHLERTVRSVAPVSRESSWSGYADQQEAEYTARKLDAVRRVLQRWPRTAVLDVGCNTGTYSVLAAEAGATVVAIDSDPTVVDAVWDRARRDQLRIQPLVANLASPTPATGWMNREHASLLDRLSGRFDGVLMLAVVHHLLASERVPLDQIVDLIARLTSDLAVVEYVTPSDPLFRRLSRGRDDLYRAMTRDVFERQAAGQFTVVAREVLIAERRWLYTLRLHGRAA